MAVAVFASAEEFLNSAHPNKLDCLILDVRMPGMSGIELHRHLLASDCKVPTVFITAHASDDRARSEARSDWTVAYLAKPFSDDELLDAVHAASRLKSNA
jgi:FixJ family two-component response regulator